MIENILLIIALGLAIIWIIQKLDLFPEPESRKPRVETNPHYMHYDPLFTFKDEGMEALIKLSVNRTVNYMHDCGFYWANEVNIWAISMFTIQLQSKLEVLFKELNNRQETEFDYKECVREIIQNYHLEVVKVYPELKEY